MNDAIRRNFFGGFALAVLCLAGSSAHADPALWVVEGKNSKVYLFGSVHVLPEGGFAIQGELDKAWRDAEIVCREVDTTAIDEAETMALTIQYAIDPEGRGLFDLLGPDAGRARALAATAGVDLAQLAPFEPWFAGLTVTLVALKQNGFDVEHGVEQIIDGAARKDGKASCGLETLEEQLGMLDGLPQDMQREMLMQSLSEAGEIKTIMGRLVDAWREGDMAALAGFLEDDFAEYPELAEGLVYARNERWVGQVNRMLEGDDDVLLVVGALHLAGPRGLPALLKDRGLRIRRL